MERSCQRLSGAIRGRRERSDGGERSEAEGSNIRFHSPCPGRGQRPGFTVALHVCEEELSLVEGRDRRLAVSLGRAYNRWPCLALVAVRLRSSKEQQLLQSFLSPGLTRQPPSLLDHMIASSSGEGRNHSARPLSLYLHYYALFKRN